MPPERHIGAPGTAAAGARPMHVLSLFSGIGAFDLGLERAGMRTVAFCEIDPFARRVLAKHWPEVPCYDDVRSLTADRLRADGISVDVIAGGFPCQDISVAGRGAGIDAERSGLWSEFARLIGEIRPQYAIVENVAALLGRGMGDVLGDLAAIGFDAEWYCIPASAVGAPHIRDRIWIVAYADSGRRREQGDAGSLWSGRAAEQLTGCCRAGDMAEPSRPRLAIGPGTLREWAHAATTGTGWWAVEPDVGRVVTRTAARVDRRKRLIGLGNSLVPQIPELIGRAILAAECAP